MSQMKESFMIDFDVDVDFDSSDIMDVMAESYAKQLEENDTQCPNEECVGTEFDVKMWVNENDRFEGEGRCLSCNEIFELDIDDTDARESVQEIQDSIESLEDAF